MYSVFTYKFAHLNQKLQDKDVMKNSKLIIINFLVSPEDSSLVKDSFIVLFLFFNYIT